MGTTTPNLALYKPAYQEAGSTWMDPVNANMDTLDAAIIAEHNADGTHAAVVTSKLVTNGDTHDHSGGDGAQIAHTSLSAIGTNTHTTIDTFIASKAAASGLASLNASTLVVQNPANATATPTASKIPIADSSGKLDDWLREVYISKASDTSNTTTTLADITGLSFTAAANKDYLIEAFIAYTTAATTTGIELAINGPASPAGFAGQTIACTAASTLAGRTFNAYNTSGGALSAAITGVNIAKMEILFKNGANAGTVTLRFASEVSASNVTVVASSILKYRLMN
ncbi:MAG: hypothetical protein HY880_04120 [Deltaproteobacteria bacterium]|nr:hypothetical protein [Deltaproteobacteria bacterium]